MDELNKFLEHKVVEIINIGKTTSDRYSRIALHLKRQGTPIPSKDIYLDRSPSYRARSGAYYIR